MGRKRKGGLSTGAVVGIFFAFVLLVLGMMWILRPQGQTILGVGMTDTGGELEIKDRTQSLTVTLDSFTYPPDSASVTEVYPTYWVVTSDGSFRVNGAKANTTSSVLDEVLSVYGDDSSYYVDPVLDVKITGNNQIIETRAYPIVSDSNLKVTCYDNTGSTALTAEANANKSGTIDYAGPDMGADEDYTFYCVLKVNSADKRFQFCALGTGYEGDADEFYPVWASYNGETYEFEKSKLHKELKDATITTYTDSNASKTADYDEVWRLKGVDALMMKEWEEIKIKFIGSADSTGLDENTGDLFFFQALDCSWEKGDDNKLYFDYYQHDKNEQHNTVGLAEPETSPFGLTSGVVIEGH